MLAHAAIAVAASVLMACPAEDGLVLVDVCTPAEAEDPLADGRTLRITSKGDIASSITFDLEEQSVYEQPAAFPMGARIGLKVEILNAGDVPVAAGQVDEVTVRAVTRVCACLTRLEHHEMELCRDMGCVYDVERDHCTFYSLSR